MRWLLSLCLIPLSLQARTMQTRIIEVDAGKTGEDVMVLAETDGRVLWADHRDETLVMALRDAVDSRRWVGVEYDDESGRVQGAQLLDIAVETAPVVAAAPQRKASYRPTVFNSMSEAQRVFDSMDNQTKDDSQCYNRAHGWAYDMWRNHNVYSLKVFIFYTRRYIREYNYKWWFHVAPMTWVHNGRTTEEMVMDRSFTQSPVSIRTWTNIFMKNGASCPIVERYSHYRNYQEEEYCYLIRGFMYYSTPRDLEYLESRGRLETDWNLEELRAGRQQAFINWQRYDP